MAYKMNTFAGVIIMLAAVVVAAVVNFELAWFGSSPGFLSMVGTVALIIGWFFFIFICQENMTLLKILCAVGVYTLLFSIIRVLEIDSLLLILSLPVGFCFYGIEFFEVNMYHVAMIVSFVMSIISFWIYFDRKRELKVVKKLELEKI